MIEKLKQTPIFENLTKEEYDKLSSISSIKKYKKDNIVFYRGDKPKYLYLLLEGSIKIYTHNNKGNEVILKVLNETSLIAELASLEDINYPANCMVLKDSTLLAIDFENFKEIFLNDPKFLLMFIKSLTRKIMYLESVIESNIKLDAKSKIAKYIYENEEEFIKTSNAKIARELNITPETFSRVIKKFKDEGILVNESNKFSIIDRESLSVYFS